MLRDQPKSYGAAQTNMVKRSTIKRRSRSAASVSLDIFGDRWSLVIVRDLMLSGYAHLVISWMVPKESQPTSLLTGSQS